MSLDRGTKLGPYEILEPIGAGGMGEVYKARDTRLNRMVAIKISATQFTKRFEREARTVAALNHPHICALYDVGPDYLVMEFVEGPTLAERIADSPRSMDEALIIAQQIAEALEAAHEKAIVHRDLKPANVKFTSGGQVKVLDFGLAKALDTETVSNPRSSPTLTLSATRAGVILGTALYMSPEQARGIAADKRADIWSFGVVLFEMLTGRSVFTGETVSDTLAAVLKTDPDWSALVPETSAPIRRLLRRCLERDRKRRLRDIGDALIEIDEARLGPAQATAAPKPPLRMWGWVVAGALVLVLAATAIFHRVRSPDLRPMVRLNAELGPGVVLAPNTLRGGLALSPDGRRLVCRISGADGKMQLGIRPLDKAEVTILAGTEGAYYPFFSPDGRWIGFFADRKLKKVAVEGGVPVTLCDAPVGLGASWGDDGNIVATLGLVAGLSRVPSVGGTPAAVSSVSLQKGELRHSFPHVLPGSKAVLFTAYKIAGGFREPNIEILSFASGERKSLGAGFAARYLPSGHLVYIHQKTLFAVPFDLKRLVVTGSPQPIVGGISNAQDRGAEFDSSQDGIFVYAEEGDARRSVFWLDSAGKPRSLDTAAAIYRSPRFSPDGKHLAFVLDDGQGNDDVWVKDLERGSVSKRTLMPGPNQGPVWTADSRYIVFSSSNPAAPGIYATRADGSGEPNRLAEARPRMLPSTISADGRWIAGIVPSPGGGTEIWTASLEDEGSSLQMGSPETFLRSPFIKLFPAFSPDGRWLAYISNESGRHEVYVRSFRGAAEAQGSRQISTEGGYGPIWSPNRRELYFRADDRRMMVVNYASAADSFTAGKPRVWSEQRMVDTPAPPTLTFDLAPDGKRFAVILYPDGSVDPKPVMHLTFLVNFFDELRRRVPSRDK